MSYPFIIQGNNVTVVIGSTPHTISNTHITYNKVLNAIKNQDWETVKNIIEPKKVILEYGAGNVSVQGDQVFWQGYKMHNALTKRMVQMLQDEFPIKPLVLFMERLMMNPSKRAVDELYAFLERNNLPITSDGHFLAYKKVNDDYTDVHTGTVVNKPWNLYSEEEKNQLKKNSLTCGRENEVVVYYDELQQEICVEMNRNRVDDNKENTCSEGLHFCSIEYLKSFSGTKIIILKINPRDVVSIPVDYNFSKGRTCRYQVIGELGVDPEQAFTSSVQENANGSKQQDLSNDNWPESSKV